MLFIELRKSNSIKIRFPNSTHIQYQVSCIYSFISVYLNTIIITIIIHNAIVKYVGQEFFKGDLGVKITPQFLGITPRFGFAAAAWEKVISGKAHSGCDLSMHEVKCAKYIFL